MESAHIKNICAQINETPPPLESYDPELAEQFRLIENKQHPRIRAIWIGREACAEVGYRGKLLILTNSLTFIRK